MNFSQAVVALSVQQDFDPSKMGGDMAKKFMAKIGEMTKGLSENCGKEVMEMIGKFSKGMAGQQ